MARIKYMTIDQNIINKFKDIDENTIINLANGGSWS